MDANLMTSSNWIATLAWVHLAILGVPLILATITMEWTEWSEDHRHLRKGTDWHRTPAPVRTRHLSHMTGEIRSTSSI